MKPELISKSKFLSLALRHKPESAKLILDVEGYAPVSDVLIGIGITLDELNEIVDTNDKKRFAFNADNTKIRASQGHSLNEVKVKLQLLSEVPTTLYHGTKQDTLAIIMKQGLSKMNRNYVHLSDNVETATEVANRRKGKSVILKVDVMFMRASGFKFYLSENGVYLTDNVPPKFLSV